MGLTFKTVGKNLLHNKNVTDKTFNAKVIALAGNPNVGKSTLFNKLTGMKQHTGNWAGKTVSNAVGEYKDKNNRFVFVDIPGTYSLMAHSSEEEVARDYICFGRHDITVVVCDATCLERNLNLVLQTIEICEKVIVCVNLMDEAEKKCIKINTEQLSKSLGVPVVGITARNGIGIEKLIKTLNNPIFKTPIKVIYKKEIETAIAMIMPQVTKLTLNSKLKARFVSIKLLEGDKKLICSIEKALKKSILKNEELNLTLENAKKYLKNNGITDEKFKDYIVSGLILTAEEICNEKVVEKVKYNKTEYKADKILTHKIFGPLIMLALLGVVFWITLIGANYPSELLWKMFSYFENIIFDFSVSAGLSKTICEMLIHGVYRVSAWVVSVMLPPMAIFFPFFTLLEDLGFLPRIAFNLDKGFKKCSACGKQALTMCMGFGCNAVGITGCRIIDSERERLIAVITNSFVPCNGRFPILIAMIGMFFTFSGTGVFNSLFSALILTVVILLGIAVTFLSSFLLSKTILKGKSSSFTLELPPYRIPKIGSVIIRSVFDRILFVLGRAVTVAAPAGFIIWIAANLKLNNTAILQLSSELLNGVGTFMGLDGVILLGFILGFPANEIVIPIIIMTYMANGTLTDYTSLAELKTLLISNGWTIKTAICTMVFSVMHWPCSTSLITVKKETGSLKWTLAALILPTLFGIIFCAAINFLWVLFS